MQQHLKWFQKIEKTTTLLPLISIVWKQFVLHVGVVVAWTLFDKSESPTKILDWLEDVYPTTDLQPNHICIDKVCMVLQTAISNGSWDNWTETSHIIADSYHYINH